MLQTENIREWLSLVAIAISLGGVIYSWFTARSSVNSARLDKADSQFADHLRRIQELENELKHMPAKDDVNDLKLAIAKLEGSVGRLDESLGSVARTVHRVDDYLRKEGKGA